MKVAGAPISWGVSELPTWGYRLAPERVLSEMASLGLEATELGPPDYLPADPASRRALLDSFGLGLAGGFLAVVLHEEEAAALAEISREAAALAESGAHVLVLAAALPGDSYDSRASLSPTEWTRLGRTLRDAARLVASFGMALTIHPHAGTAIARADDVRRVLNDTDVALCLDTGHLFLGGADPADVVEEAAGRVRHVHLKDVDAPVARRLVAGEMAYADAVRAGLYTALGAGDLDISGIFTRLQDAGYSGWYVLEQDTALTAEPAPDAGPAAAARQSLEYFYRIAGAVNSSSAPRRSER
jgi:inosose dehydratase